MLLTCPNCGVYFNRPRSQAKGKTVSCSVACSTEFRFGEKLTIDNDGYIRHAGKLFHRELMEKQLGRPLLSTEIVHHNSEDKQDNYDLSITTRSEHARYHWSGEKNPNTLYTDDQLVRMLLQIHSGRTIRSVAKEYGIGRVQLGRVLHGKVRLRAYRMYLDAVATA